MRLPRLVFPLALAAALAPATAHAAPKRIVALTPFTANTLADVGVRPVAVGTVLGGSDRFSPRLNGVRRLLLSHPNGPNLEQLALLNPQLVLSAPIWRKGSPGMRKLGMKVDESDPRSVHATVSETLRIGRLVGRAAAAKRRAAALETDIHAATRGIAKHPRVLLVLGVGSTTYAFLPGTWGADVVQRAGGRLITAGLHAGSGYARISDEFVVAQDPDVIIAVPHGEPGDLGKIAGRLRDKVGWRTTKAAKRRHVYVSTGNSLLQAFTDVGRTIRDVRTKYLGT